MDDELTLCAFNGLVEIYRGGTFTEGFHYLLDNGTEISIHEARLIAGQFGWVELPERIGWIGLLSHDPLPIKVVERVYSGKHLSKSTKMMLRLADSLWLNLRRVGPERVSEAAFNDLGIQLIDKIKEIGK